MAVKPRRIWVVCNERSMLCDYKIYICKWSLGDRWAAVTMQGSMFSQVSGGAHDPSERVMLMHALETMVAADKGCSKHRRQQPAPVHVSP